MPGQLTDAEAVENKGLRQLEASLQSLWEKAHLVSDQLLRLKSENKELQNRILSLESKESRWSEELRQRERELEKIHEQLAKAQSNGNSLFSKEESEALKIRIKELIVKVNSRL